MPLSDVGCDAEAGHVPVVRDPEELWDEDEVLDQVLRLVADHHRSLGALLGRPAFSPTIAELRQSPLGRDLRLLVTADRGTATSATVRAAAERVAEVLLRPLAADGYAVPAWFWTTAFGRLLARVRRAEFQPDGLLSPAEASAWLGAEQTVVEGWLADGAIEAVADEQGQLLVSREAVARRRAVARELTVVDRPQDVLVDEHPLAS